jgi:cellulose synthase/poly-beta-1,6-N-acetylglucosamine synthase-like glycosyltransferase
MSETTIGLDQRRRRFLDTPSAKRDKRVPDLDSSPIAPAALKIRSKAVPRQFSKLSVLMAVYNEEATLWACVQEILSTQLPSGICRQIILVDDASTDLSWALAQKLAKAHPEVRLFQQPFNQGKPRNLL